MIFLSPSHPLFSTPLPLISIPFPLLNPPLLNSLPSSQLPFPLLNPPLLNSLPTSQPPFHPLLILNLPPLLQYPLFFAFLPSHPYPLSSAVPSPCFLFTTFPQTRHLTQSHLSFTYSYNLFPLFHNNFLSTSSPPFLITMRKMKMSSESEE